jgi:hypothetical protein
MKESTLWEWAVQISLVLVAIVASGPMVYRWVDGITARLGWQGWKARLVAGVISFLLGAAGLIAGGQITPALIRPENFAMLVITVWGASQAHYSKMRHEEAAEAAQMAYWEALDKGGQE